MRISSFILLIFLLSSTESQGPVGGDGNTECCPSIYVNVSGENSHLAGTYTFKEKEDSKREEACVNGCIYKKDNSPSTDEYCFERKDADANLECQVVVCFQQIHFKNINLGSNANIHSISYRNKYQSG